MSDLPVNQYEPDYATPPGEILEEYLEAYGITEAELATRTGLAKKTVDDIIKANLPITPEIAVKIQPILNRPAHFWSNLQCNYEQTLARLAEREGTNIVRLDDDVAAMFPSSEAVNDALRTLGQLIREHAAM